ncbi:MAG TPA: hypothetical protein VGY58_03230, partial [Gemmataceae bacterium]|nr:hypothetical protein [Gemmataceae bacterium]
MSSHSPEEKAPQQGSLQSMLARLRGMMQALKSSEPAPPAQQELLPTWDEPPRADKQHSPAAEVPQTLDQPLLTRSAEPPATALPETLDQFTASAAEPATAGQNDGNKTAAALTSETERAAEAPAEPPAPQLCPHCQAPRKAEQVYCDDCGWIFPVQQTPSVVASLPPGSRIRARYSLGQKIGERDGIARFRGLDHGAGDDVPVSVTILRARCPAPVEAVPAAEATSTENGTAPSGDTGTEPVPTDTGNGEKQDAPHDTETAAVRVEAVPVAATWPGLAWEQALLERAAHSSLPRVLERFSEGEYEYLIESAPLGQVLWDAWDEPQYRAQQRFGWLKQIAGALHRLHESGAILEGLRPDIVTITAGDQATITDLSDLLPLPLPPDTPIKATYY